MTIFESSRATTSIYSAILGTASKEIAQAHSVRVSLRCLVELLWWIRGNTLRVQLGMAILLWIHNRSPVNWSLEEIARCQYNRSESIGHNLCFNIRRGHWQAQFQPKCTRATQGLGEALRSLRLPRSVRSSVSSFIVSMRERILHILPQKGSWPWPSRSWTREHAQRASTPKQQARCQT